MARAMTEGVEMGSTDAGGFPVSRRVKAERRFPCSLWIAAASLDSGNDKSLSEFLAAVQRAMDQGMVPGLFAEALVDGKAVEGFPEGELSLLTKRRICMMPSSFLDMPLPFPVWLAHCGLTFALDDKKGFGTDTVKTMFALSAQRDKASLLAWRRYLRGVSVDLIDEALTLCAAKSLDDAVAPSGKMASSEPFRSV